jgi:hypothetical protein
LSVFEVATIKVVISSFAGKEVKAHANVEFIWIAGV